jgi:hypothetical protein
MSWGTRRRNTIITIFFLIVFGLIGYLLYDALYEPPNCFDKKWNGDEVNIDCGGSCALRCESQVLNPIIHWTRSFEVSPGVYNVLAYLENPNVDSGIDNVSYRFRVYDDQNVLLQERRGSTSILPKSVLPLLENTLPVGKLDANRVVFEFTEPLVWYKKEISENLIVVQDEEISRLEDSPRIRALVRNTGISPIKDLKVIAIVYDLNNNAMASSQTILKTVPANQNMEIFFAWPKPFESEMSRFELIPLYDRSSQ